jgi:hypothetical protein
MLLPDALASSGMPPDCCLLIHHSNLIFVCVKMQVDVRIILIYSSRLVPGARKKIERG